MGERRRGAEEEEDGEACSLYYLLVGERRREAEEEEDGGGVSYVAFEQLRNPRRDSPHVIVS